MLNNLFHQIVGTRVNAKQAWKRRSSSISGGLDRESTAEGRHPSWFEACFDLIIVASFTALSEGLKHNLNNESTWVRFTAPIIYYFQFAPIFYSWSVVDLYINRFDLDGILGGLTIFSHALVIGFMNVALLNLNEAESKEQRMDSLFAYAMCNMFSNIFSFAMYLRVYLQTDIKLMSCSFMITHILVALLWILLGIFTHNEYIMYPIWAVILWVCHNRIDLLIWLGRHVVGPSSGFVNNTPPLDIPLITERVGLLVIIGIGESLMATVEGIKYGDGGNHWNVIFACTHAFLLKVAYFDVFDCIGEEVERHALKRKETGISFIVNQIFCVMTVTLSSQMMKDSHEYYNSEGGAEVIPVSARTMFGLAMSGALLSFFWMSNHHIREEQEYEYHSVLFRYQVMYITMALLFGICYFIPWHNPYILEFIVQLIFTAYISFEFFCRKYIRQNEYDEVEQGDHHSPAIFFGVNSKEEMATKANTILSGDSDTDLAQQDDHDKSSHTAHNNENQSNSGRRSVISQITSVSKVFSSISNDDGNDNNYNSSEGVRIHGDAMEGYQSINYNDSASEASWTGGTNTPIVGTRTNSPIVGTPPSSEQHRRSSSHYGRRSSRGSMHNTMPLSPEDYEHSSDHV